MKNKVNQKMMQRRAPVPPLPSQQGEEEAGGRWGGHRYRRQLGWRDDKIGWGAQKQEHTLHLSQQLLSSAASGRRRRRQKFKCRGWKEKYHFSIARDAFS